MTRLRTNVTNLYFGSFIDTYQPHIIEEAKEDFMNMGFSPKGGGIYGIYFNPVGAFGGGFGVPPPIGPI